MDSYEIAELVNKIIQGDFKVVDQLINTCVASNKCQYTGCDESASCLAYGRDGEITYPISCCEEHADIIANQENPEYVVGCPGCGCRFGVN